MYIYICIVYIIYVYFLYMYMCLYVDVFFMISFHKRWTGLQGREDAFRVHVDADGHGHGGHRFAQPGRHAAAHVRQRHQQHRALEGLVALAAERQGLGANGLHIYINTYIYITISISYKILYMKYINTYIDISYI